MTQGYVKTKFCVCVFIFTNSILFKFNSLIPPVSFLQAVDDVGVQGMDQVDRLAEYLVELRKHLSLTLNNQQVSNIYSVLSMLCHMFMHVWLLMWCICLGEQYCCSLGQLAVL